MIFKNVILKFIAAFIRCQHYEPRLTFLIYCIVPLLFIHVPWIFLLFLQHFSFFISAVLYVLLANRLQLLEDHVGLLLLFHHTVHISLDLLSSYRFLFDLNLQIMQFFSHKVNQVSDIFFRLLSALSSLLCLFPDISINLTRANLLNQ
jgi:hypothetical protein